MLRFVVPLLLVTSTLTAGVIDRHLLDVPQTPPQALAWGPIIAGGTHSFLASRQRVTTDGRLIDASPIPGAEGQAVTWSDGWLLIQPRFGGSTTVRHLGEEGPPRELLTFPSLGAFYDAASNGDRLAIVESEYLRNVPRVWVTVMNETNFIQRRLIEVAAETAAIAPFLDGFLLITSSRASETEWIVHAWKLDGAGTPLRVEEVHRTINNDRPEAINIVSDGGRAVITIGSSTLNRAFFVDSELGSTFIPFAPAPDTFIGNLTPLVTSSGFAVAASQRTNTGWSGRLVRVDTSGKVTSDEPADPIASADRLGQVYLVFRPWGVVATATGDPRNISSQPVQISGTGYTPSSTIIDTTTSGNATLVSFGTTSGPRSILLDDRGRPLGDSFSAGHPSTASPEGFTYVWVEGDDIKARRLGRNGSWIDPAAVVIATEPDILAVGAHWNGMDLLVAWTTSTDIAWMRRTASLQPLQSTQRRPRQLSQEFSGDPRIVRVIGKDDRRLILTQDTFECRTLCIPIDLRLNALAIDANGNAAAATQSFDSFGGVPHGVGLADGSWVIPVVDVSPHNLLHLNADGTLRERITSLHASGMVSDMRPTADGWEALVDQPTRLVEVTGAATPKAVTTLSTTSQPHFGAGNVLAFLTPFSYDTPASLWSGRLESRDGDLAVGMRDASSATIRRAEVEVTNQDAQIATNVFVFSGDGGVALTPFGTWQGIIPLLRPAETTRFIAHVNGAYSTQPLLFVGSDDVRDIDPTDNIAALPDPLFSRPLRGRSIRR